jgi:hypothetical protein
VLGPLCLAMGDGHVRCRLTCRKFRRHAMPDRGLSIVLGDRQGAGSGERDEAVKQACVEAYRFGRGNPHGPRRGAIRRPSRRPDKP